MAARAWDQVGAALDLMGRALEVGDVGARVAADTWVRWMSLAGHLALVTAGQGVAAWCGIETRGPMADAFEAYIGQLADLPGQAGKQFELDWEAARGRARRDLQFGALLVPDVAHWRAWTRLAVAFAQVSTAWQRRRRNDGRYASRLRRVAEMPATAARDLDLAASGLHAIMRLRGAAGPGEAAGPVAAGPAARGTGKALKLLAEDVIDRLVDLATRQAPERELTAVLEEYRRILEDTVEVPVARARQYDRHADRYCVARGLPAPWTREQPEVDERLGELLDAQRARLAGAGGRIDAQEMERVLDAGEEELEDLSRWPARSAQESNAAFARMVRRESRPAARRRRRRARG